MSFSANVVRRRATFYFRVAVPARLRLLVQRRELWRSLKTKDPSIARKRAALMHLLTDRLWRDLERLMLINIERVDRPAVQAMIDHWLKAQLDEDAYRREVGGDDLIAGVVFRARPDGYPDEVVRRITYEERAEADEDPFETLTPEQLPAGHYVLRDVSERELFRRAQGKIYRSAADRHVKEVEDIAEEHVKALFALLGHEVDEFSGKFETATYMMMTAHKELWEAVQARDTANWRPRLDRDPAHELVKRLTVLPAPPAVNAEASPVSVDAPPQTSGKVLSKLSKEAIKAITRRETLAKKRVDDYEAAVRTFIDFLGGDCEVNSITNDDAIAFKNALEEFPSNASKRMPYRELASFRAKLEAARSLDEKNVLAANTINTKYITPLRAIFVHRDGGKLKPSNPFKDVTAKPPRKVDRSKGRRDVSDTEVVRLLALPLFTGAKASSGAGLYQPGSVRVNDWRFWVPLICLFSGMRLNEACGLGVADIRRSAEGIDYFDVRDEIEGQRLKSAAARRRIPIHSALVEIGFLAFVEEARRANRIRLFEDLEEDQSGYFSGKASKFFADLRPRYQDEDPDQQGRLTFHSKRHTVTTKLRAAGIREDVSKALVGHEQGDVHGGYGHVDLPTLREAVESIVYPALRLDRVRQCRPMN